MHFSKDETSISAKGPSPVTHLRIATWNIHSGIGSDDRMDLKRVVAVLKTIDADVIGLQEVGWHRPHHFRVNQFAFLRDHTGYEVIEGLVRDPLRSRFGNALLTRLPATRTKWIDLKVRGHAPRGAVAAELEGRAGPLRFAVTHLGLNPLEREMQAIRLVKAIRSGDGASVATLVLGDFNMLRSSTRASRVLDERFPTCVGAPTYPSRLPLFSLDRIYASRHWAVRRARVIDTELARTVSDHLPLVADVALLSEPTLAGDAKAAASAKDLGAGERRFEAEAPPGMLESLAHGTFAAGAEVRTTNI